MFSAVAVLLPPIGTRYPGVRPPTAALSAWPAVGQTSPRNTSSQAACPATIARSTRWKKSVSTRLFRTPTAAARLCGALRRVEAPKTANATAAA